MERPTLRFWPQATLAAFCAAFFFVRVFHGVWFLPFVDEAEHLVGGMMLNHGARLYSGFVDAHGPVVYMLTQAYGAVFGWSQPNGARMISPVLALGVAACVAGSPALPRRSTRFDALALFLGLLATVWLLQALYMVNYHAIGGMLGGAALALFLVPMWLGQRASGWHACAAGVCLVLLGATAYSFGPGGVLLAISAVWASLRMHARPMVAWLAAGGLAGMLSTLLWLLAFGDLRGYLAFHFLFNQFVFAKYIPFSIDYFIDSLIPSTRPDALVHSLALASWAISFLLTLFLEGRRTPDQPHIMGPIIVGFGGLLALCARGGTLFQDGSFLVCSIVTVSIALPAALTELGQRQRVLRLSGWDAAATGLIGCCVLFAELAMRHALDSPWGMTRSQMVVQPRFELGESNAPRDVRIRALTSADDRILVLPFAPDVYLAAGRMPMDGFNYYLPWDAEYARSPWLGVRHDLCAAMAQHPPKLVYFNNWIVWNRFAMADYAPCVATALAIKYQRQPDFPDLYLRLASSRSMQGICFERQRGGAMPKRIAPYVLTQSLMVLPSPT